MDWDEMARSWLEAAPALEASFQPVFDVLFAAADLQPGMQVLDVGSGTGPTLVRAADLVTETGHVTGIDIAPPLLARAAERVPGHVSLIEADAGKHAFAAGAYDALIANFGIMFFSDNAEGFANLRKALRPGAQMTATFWGLPKHNPWFSMPRAILDKHIPDVPRPDRSAPGPMRFADPEGLLAVLRETGWAPEVVTHDLKLTPPGGPEGAATQFMQVVVGMAVKGMDVPDGALARIEAEITDACTGYVEDGHVSVPARIHLLTAKAV